MAPSGNNYREQYFIHVERATVIPSALLLHCGVKVWEILADIKLMAVAYISPIISTMSFDASQRRHAT